MTQEDKQLLLQDLATRLPYGVKVHINSCVDEQNQMELFDVNLVSETIGVGNEKWAFRAVPIIDIDDNTKIVRPYLRPLSSMTEKEKEEIALIRDRDFQSVRKWIHNESIKETGNICPITFGEIDYCNKKHLDYRGLIPKNLALEAPEGMYNIKEK